MENKKLKCYFSPEQVATGASVTPPSIRKIEPVVYGALDRGLIELVPVLPVSASQLETVHAAHYVDGVLAGKIANGFGNRDLRIATAATYAAGSLYEAARGAIEHGVTLSPTQGFHHACYASGGGYCTFNGLVYAARKLIEDGDVKRIAIVDGDAHWGDGTDDCLHHLPDDLRKAIFHLPCGGGSQFANDVLGFPRPEQGVQKAVDRVVGLVEAFEADLVIYQAGADAHRDDPYGGGFLNNAAWVWRDRLLFAGLRGINIPVCFNLAGGYQEDGVVVGLHLKTIEEARLYV